MKKFHQKILRLESARDVKNLLTEDSIVEEALPEDGMHQKLLRIWIEILKSSKMTVSDSFFHLGGDSIKAVQLCSRIHREFGVLVDLSGIFKNPTIADQVSLINIQSRTSTEQIPVVGVAKNYPLSSSQQRIWVLSQMGMGSVAYNEATHIILSGSFDLEKFKRAIYSTIERHEILRTVFKENDRGEIRQWIIPFADYNFSVSYHDFRNRANGMELAQSYMLEDSHIPFSMEDGPLVRAGILHLSEDNYVFYFNMHHIITDEWSMKVLSKEVFDFYDVYTKGSSPEFLPLRLQYKDYVAWMDSQQKLPLFQKHKSYWLKQLSGELPLLNLPTAKVRPKIKTFQGAAIKTRLTTEVIYQSRAFVREHGGSLVMCLQAALKILLYRYTGQKDIIVGSPVSGRTHPELEDQIGCYVNVLALRNSLEANASFIDFYDKVKSTTLDAYAHQMYPFDQLVSDLAGNREMNRSAVFDVLLDYHQPNEKIKEITPPEDNIDGVVEMGKRYVKFDLEFHFTEMSNDIFLHVNYNTDIYDKIIITQLISHYKELLSALLYHPKEPIGKVRFLNIDEESILLHEFNDTYVACTPFNTVLDLFDEQVKEMTNQVSVVYERQCMTYDSLNKEANQLAHYLISQCNVGANDLVGIMTDRSEKMIVAILAVLKSGAAYVPIDPAYPKVRKSYIIEDTGIKALILQSDRLFEVEQYCGKIIAIDVQLDTMEDVVVDPCVSVSPDHLAYVIYTSGSTGNPKGVKVTHGNLFNYIHWANSYYFHQSRAPHFGLFTSLSFDLTVTSIFCSLTSGGCLTIYNQDEEVLDILYECFNGESQVDTIKLTPSHVSLLTELEWKTTKMEKVIVGGEALRTEHVNILKNISPSIEIYNEYGPTEATVGCVVKKILENEPISIGQPIANTQIYIVNPFGLIEPIGVAGEICIGGLSVTQGYLNQPEMTQSKFIENPYREGERLYKTGDIGRWIRNGEIELFGRKDDQVNLRGYRIELQEISNALLTITGIGQAEVVFRKGQEQRGNLVAYFTATHDYPVQRLRNHLEGLLPMYMVPTYYIQLEKFPLTINGKIDRDVLPYPDEVVLNNDVPVPYMSAQTDQEKLLITIWEEVLGRVPIGVENNFYSLGGDSIKSIQVASRLKQLGYSLRIEDILKHPVLKDQALFMEASHTVVSQSDVVGEVSLTPILHWFFSNRNIKAPHHYNQSVALKSIGYIDAAILEKCMAHITQHHDALRMTFQRKNGVMQCYNHDSTWKGYSIFFHDFRGDAEGQVKMDRICAELQSDFNLSTGPLFYIGHFRFDDGDQLVLIIHHVVIDGVSWRILLEDFSDLYIQYKTGTAATLPLKTDSFKRWASLLNDFASAPQVSLEKSYWEQICSQEVPVLCDDMTHVEVDTMSKAIDSFTLTTRMTELLQTRVHHVCNTEINDILLTTLGLAVKEVFRVSKIAVKMEGHGREEIIPQVDISRTIGWFTSTYPIILDLAGSDPINNLITVKESVRAVPNKGVGYGIVKYLSGGLPEIIVPSISFNYLGDFGSRVGKEEEPIFEYVEDYRGKDIAANNVSDEPLHITGMVVSGELTLYISYSSHTYRTHTIKKLVKTYHSLLIQFIENLAGASDRHLTPSDLTFKSLSLNEVKMLNPGDSLEDVYPLSPMQEGLYYHWLSDDFTATYFEQISYRIKSADLHLDELKMAYDLLVCRHPMLRTSFTNAYADRPLQVVRKMVPSHFSSKKVPIERLDEIDVFVAEVKRNDRERGFDLETGSQMRLEVLDLGDDVYEFIWSHHHILMDGWCMRILIHDFYSILNGIHTNKPINLPRVTPYSTYIQWLSHIDQEAIQHYWKSYLDGYDGQAQIPFRVKKAIENYDDHVSERLSIDGVLYSDMDTQCKQLGITQNTFMQGVWGYLLAKYNQTQDVVFGAVVSGRPGELHGVEEMVGLFINTIPVRVTHQDTQTPNELLKQLQESEAASSMYHYGSLSKIQTNSPFGNALINHIMVFENYPVQEVIKTGVDKGEHGVHMSLLSMDVFERTNYDLNIVVMPSSTGLLIEFRYDKSQYDAGLMINLVNHFKLVISQFIKLADKPLSDIALLTEHERNVLLGKFVGKKVEYPKDKSIIDLFKDQVRRTPDRVAVVFKEGILSYSELDDLSDRLAMYLIEKYYLHSEQLVAIKLERNEWQIISILAILKAGAAYVPIDPDYPQERITYIIEDSCCKVCVDEDTLSLFQENQQAYQGKFIASNVSPSNLAYVIYTSGTTGYPKGVLVEHRNVVRLFFSDTSLFDFKESDVWSMFHSYCFDFSVWEIFGAILFGGKLVVVPESITKDLEAFSELLVREKVTILNQTPSVFNVLQELLPEQGDGHSLRYVIFGGEALNPTDLRDWRKAFPQCRLINMYGITETTVHVTYKELMSSDLEESRSNIGTPIPTLCCYLLDDKMQLVPTGIPGEIYVSGEGLARGYLNREELTRTRFVQNPFEGEKSKLYKTGDLARWLPNGDMEYLGRIDDQVKIRGHRIELGEIEHVILRSGQVSQVVVLVKETEKGGKQLLAFLVTHGHFSRSTMLSYLKDALPEYMVPAHLIEVSEIPLTGNKKVDKNVLLEHGLMTREKQYMLPRNEMEEKIAEIWKSVLGLEQVGIYDDFFQLGGDSIISIRVISRLNKIFRCNIKVAQLYKNNNIADLRALIEESLSKVGESNIHDKFVEQVIETLKQEVIGSSLDPTHIEDVYPMSDIQKGMVLLSSSSVEKPIYHDQMIYQVPRIDVTVFEKSLKLMVENHAALRTELDWRKYSQEAQIVYHQVPLEIDFCDLTSLHKDDQESYIREYMKREREDHPFDFQSIPLWRASIFHIDLENSVFLFQCHHAILDGWSVASFNTELFTIYQHLRQFSDYKIQPLKCNWKDAISHEIHEKNNLENIQFWREELSEYKRLDIFSDDPVEEVYRKSYSDADLRKLKGRIQEDHISLKTLFFGAYVYALNMLSFEDDIVIGLVTNNRPTKEDGDKVLGCFLNTLPVRMRLYAYYQTSWMEYLKGIHQLLLNLKNYEGITLMEILKQVGGRQGNENPFFDVLFNFIDFHVYDAIYLEKEAPFQHKSSNQNVLALESYEATNTALDLTVDVTAHKIHLTYKQNRSLRFDASLSQLHKYLENFILYYINSPADPIGKIHLLDPAERHELLTVFNATEKEIPKGKTLIDFFAEKVSLYPNSVALVFEDKRFTYAQLDECSSRMASYLNIKRGVGQGDFVGVLLEKSEWLIIAMVAIMKTGGIYVPIDPQYPQERVDYIKQDCKCKVVVDSKELDDFKTTMLSYEYKQFAGSISTETVAYIIYTSGSTGLPKGVMVAHTGIVNTILSQIEQFEIDQHSRGLQFASASFDASISEIFIILLSGATLFMVSEEERSDPEKLEAFIEDHQIDVATIPPSMLRLMDVQRLKSLKKLITAGEAAAPDKVSEYIEYGTFYNAYGPTENSICASIYRLEKGSLIPSNNIPIGKPIANTSVFILSDRGELQPKGVVGEICLSGKGLSKGYLNLFEQTTQKFISHPFVAEKVLYKTGDLGRWLPDGNLEFLGRKDDQVKIRGNRVELGEIEQALLAYDTVDEVVVLFNDVALGELVVYFVSKETQQGSVLRAMLKKKLPHYMVPAHYVQLEALPVTVNGKIDKKALLQYERINSGQDSYVPPRNQVEHRLVEIWKEILKCKTIGIEDDLFELGGHSLKVVQMMRSYQEAFGVYIELKDLMQHSTLSSHARLVVASVGTEDHRIQPLEQLEHYVLSDAQKRLWILSQVEAASVAYNMPSHVELKGIYNIEKFILAVHATIKRHEILRTIFKENEAGEIRQWVLPAEKLNFEIGFKDFSTAGKMKEAIRFIQTQSRKPFDLEQGPLLRASLLKISDDRFLFYYNMHHIICDGWSMDILARDVFAYYESFIHGSEPALANLNIQYKDYAAWRLNQMDTKRFKDHKDYWVSHLSGNLPVVDLLPNSRRPKVKTYNGSKLSMRLSKEVSEQLKETSAKQGGSLFMMLLTTLNILIYKYTRQKDIIVGCPVAGREHADLEDQIGFYVNTLVLRNKIEGSKSFLDFFDSVKRSARESYTHQAYPFDQLVKDLNYKRDMSRSVLIDIVLRLDNVKDKVASLNLDQSEEILKKANDLGSKVDIEFVFQDWGDRINLDAIYNPDVYSSTFMKKLIATFKKLLEITAQFHDSTVDHMVSEITTNETQEYSLRKGELKRKKELQLSKLRGRS